MSSADILSFRKEYYMALHWLGSYLLTIIVSHGPTLTHLAMKSRFRSEIRRLTAFLRKQTFMAYSPTRLNLMSFSPLPSAYRGLISSLQSYSMKTLYMVA